MSRHTQLPDRATLLAMTTIMNIKDLLKKGTASVCGYQVGETDTDIPPFDGLFYDDTHEIVELNDPGRRITAYPIVTELTRDCGVSRPEESYGYCELLKTKLPPYLQTAPFKIKAAFIVHGDDPSNKENYVRVEFTTDRNKDGGVDYIIMGVKADGPIDIL